ncbi:MAG: hypothetical protein M0Q12_03575 [Synergistaceae bacterium]|jgi:hypothetical protein|nr:hypothetical protein [Synergistaceae bacterium]MDD2261422.1 hypothetical protein [Clostridia bacterium]
MSTTTATILVGRAHQNHSGIIPTHLIQLTENSRPSLLLQPIEGPSDVKVVIPTLENIVDDIYLMVTVFILNKIKPAKDIDNWERLSMYDLFDENERSSLYEESKIIIMDTSIKLVFNILKGSHLLNYVDIIKEYPNDLEITLSTLKKELSAWSDKLNP